MSTILSILLIAIGIIIGLSLIAYSVANDATEVRCGKENIGDWKCR